MSTFEDALNNMTVGALAERLNLNVDTMVMMLFKQSLIQPSNHNSETRPSRQPPPRVERSTEEEQPAPVRTRASNDGSIDSRVLAAIKQSSPAKGADVVEQLDITPPQFRAAAKRLIDAKKITTKGVARGMRYIAL